MSATISSVQFSRSVVSNFLRPHGLQHARPPCPSPAPGVYSNSCPLSRWCHPATWSAALLLSPSIFPNIRVFSNESALRIRWPKYWSFSFNISPSNERSVLISFRMQSTSQSLHLLISRKTLNPSWWHHILIINKNPFVKWVLHGIGLPLHQNLIYWLSSTAVLEQSLRAICDAASWPAVLLCPK